MIKVICNRCGIDMTKSGAFGRITMEIHKRSDFADSPPESMMRRCECYFCKKCRNRKKYTNFAIALQLFWEIGFEHRRML